MAGSGSTNERTCPARPPVPKFTGGRVATPAPQMARSRVHDQQRSGSRSEQTPKTLPSPQRVKVNASMDHLENLQQRMRSWSNEPARVAIETADDIIARANACRSSVEAERILKDALAGPNAAVVKKRATFWIALYTAASRNGFGEHALIYLEKAKLNLAEPAELVDETLKSLFIDCGGSIDDLETPPEYSVELVDDPMLVTPMHPSCSKARAAGTPSFGTPRADKINLLKPAVLPKYEEEFTPSPPLVTVCGKFESAPIVAPEFRCDTSTPLLPIAPVSTPVIQPNVESYSPIVNSISAMTNNVRLLADWNSPVGDDDAEDNLLPDAVSNPFDDAIELDLPLIKAFDNFGQISDDEETSQLPPVQLDTIPEMDENDEAETRSTVLTELFSPAIVRHRSARRVAVPNSIVALSQRLSTMKVTSDPEIENDENGSTIVLSKVRGAERTAVASPVRRTFRRVAHEQTKEEADAILADVEYQYAPNPHLVPVKAQTRSSIAVPAPSIDVPVPASPQAASIGVDSLILSPTTQRLRRSRRLSHAPPSTSDDC